MSKSFDYPCISVVLPSIRKDKLENFLQCMRMQNYPENKIEILVAWGGQDGEIDDLKDRFVINVIYNDMADLEGRRLMAVENAAYDWIFVADDDNFFPNVHLLENMVQAVLKENANAAECIWQYYDKDDYPMNRYCALFGTYDPCTFYLKRQDHMPYMEKKWILNGEVINETSSYYHVRFSGREVPTMGAQGFLCRKEDVLLGNNGQVLAHMDICATMIAQGRDNFIFMKDFFGHDCVTSKRDLLKKLKRNIARYQNEQDQRRMTYNMSFGKMLVLGLTLGTFVIPLKDSVKGFIRCRDWAWFIHPVLCIQVAWIYTVSTLKTFVGKRH